MGIRVAIDLTEGGIKTVTILLVLHHMVNLKRADGKIYKTKYQQHHCSTRNFPNQFSTVCKFNNENFL